MSQSNGSRGRRTRMPSNERNLGHIADDTSNTLNAIARLEGSINVFTERVAVISTNQENQARQIVELQTSWSRSIENITNTINGEMSKMADRVEGFGKRMEERDKPQRGLMWTALGSICAALAIFITVGAFIINASTNPLSQRITGLEQLTSDHRDLELRTQNSTAADARSEQDRSDLGRRITQLDNLMQSTTAERREQYATLTARNIEVETQFKNLTAMIYYIWEQIFHSHWPIVPRDETSR